MSRPRAWLSILRLQFYPMTPVVVAWGALTAGRAAGRLDAAALALAAAAMILLEVATVLINELVDFASDALNRNAGPFTGGSRVLVRGGLEQGDVRRAVALALLGYAVCAAALAARLAPGHGLPPAAALLLVGPVFALGYTAPPLRLCYRGLGELDVALVTGPYLFLIGYAVQGAGWPRGADLAPLLPLALAIFAAITLAGIPDEAADRAVSKRTLAVLLGPRPAAVVAGVAALGASAAALRLGLPVGRTVAELAAVHGCIAACAAILLARRRGIDRRIDLSLVIALTLIPWFGLAPLVASLARAGVQ